MSAAKNYWSNKNVIVGTAVGSGTTILLSAVIIGAAIFFRENKSMALMAIVLLILMTIILFSTAIATTVKIIYNKNIANKDKYWMIPIQFILGGGQIAQIGYIDSWGAVPSEWVNPIKKVV